MHRRLADVGNATRLTPSLLVKRLGTTVCIEFIGAGLLETASEHRNTC